MYSPPELAPLVETKVRVSAIADIERAARQIAGIRRASLRFITWFSRARHGGKLLKRLMVVILRSNYRHFDRICVYGIGDSKQAAKRRNSNNLTICHGFLSTTGAIRNPLGKTFPETGRGKVKVCRDVPARCKCNAGKVSSLGVGSCRLLWRGSVFCLDRDGESVFASRHSPVQGVTFEGHTSRLGDKADEIRTTHPLGRRRSGIVVDLLLNHGAVVIVGTN